MCSVYRPLHIHCLHMSIRQFVSCDAQHPGPMVYMSVTILFSSYEWLPIHNFIQSAPVRKLDITHM